MLDRDDKKCKWQTYHTGTQYGGCNIKGNVLKFVQLTPQNILLELQKP